MVVCLLCGPSRPWLADLPAFFTGTPTYSPMGQVALRARVVLGESRYKEKSQAITPLNVTPKPTERGRGGCALKKKRPRCNLLMKFLSSKPHTPGLCATCPHPNTDRLGAKKLRLRLLPKTARDTKTKVKSQQLASAAAPPAAKVPI